MSAPANREGVTLVFFACDELGVDTCLEKLQAVDKLPCKVIVFGLRMTRLGGLVAIWGQRTNFTPVQLPEVSADTLDIARQVLEYEQVPPEKMLWIYDDTSQRLLPLASWIRQSWKFSEIQADFGGFAGRIRR